MTECHHQHDHSRGTKRLLIAFAVISVFMVVEAVGGVISGSLALIADAAHMLTDAFALGLAASAHWLSRRPADEKLHFGYRRTQVLAAFTNGLLLAALLGWIIYEAIKRLLVPVEVDWQPMLIIAIIGLGANLVAYATLHGVRSSSINIRGAMLHIISDMMGSVAAIVAAVVIWSSGWTRIDPILSMLVAVLIGHSAFRLLRETSHILLEGAPRDIDVPSLKAGLRAAAPDVLDVHDVHIWQLTPEHARLTLHARIAEASLAPATLGRIKAYLEDTYGIRESTVQIEFGTDCPDIGEDGASAAPVHMFEAPGRRHAPHPHHAGAAFVGQK